MGSDSVRTIWYMGAKTRLTAAIAAAVEQAAPEAESVLDLMSGTSVVSHALAARYRVVANDVQASAATIARGYLLGGCDRESFLDALDPAADLGKRYRENQAALMERLAPAVAVEDAFLLACGLRPETPDAALAGEDSAWADGAEVGAGARRAAARRVPRDARERARAYRAFALRETPTFLEERDTRAAGPFRAADALFRRETVLARRADPRAFPYLLASAYYPNVYLGLRQAIAVDSLRYAIDGLAGPDAARKRTHYLAALLHAASVTTSATSHFCQPRGLVRDAEVQAVLARRATSIPSRLVAFSRAIAAAQRALPPRDDHLVLQGGWREAYARWEEVRADVVYADPPYTADNYSRFYHALEVLTRYDYPELHVRNGRTTKGRYPALTRRHRSAFCVKGGVEDEVRALFRATAARGAALVFSYGEENGLLLKTWRERGDGPRRALRRLEALAGEAYAEVALERRALLHSGQGDSNRTVTELLLVARRPRARAAREQRCG